MAGDSSESDWEIVDSLHDQTRNSPTFTAASGPLLGLPSDARPYDYYSHFLGDEFLQMMVTGTNKVGLDQETDFPP